MHSRPLSSEGGVEASTSSAMLVDDAVGMALMLTVSFSKELEY